MTSTASPPIVRIGSPLRLAGAIAQLAALGVVGPAILTGVLTFMGTAIGLIPVLFGLLMIVAVPWILYALAWLETARVDGLYGIGLPPLRTRASGHGGFGGFLRTLWLQFIDPRMWRAIANFAIATVLGTIVVILTMAFASGLALAFTPLLGDMSGGVGRIVGTGIEVPIAWAIPAGIIAAVVAVAGILGLAVLHGVITRAIMAPSREALLEQHAQRSQAQRASAVRAADVERTRIERDLHDGVQPRLVSVGMTLGLAQQKIDADPEAARELIAEAHTSTKAAITELRQLARGIHASVLDDRGLDAALSALAARSHVPVHLDVRLDGRCSRDTEAAMYFAIAESLTNAAKHSRAAGCRVAVRLRSDLGPTPTLWARIEDDGVGGARVVPGGGLDGIANRAAAAGGTVRVDSPIGGPTTVEVSIPCAS